MIDKTKGQSLLACNVLMFVFKIAIEAIWKSRVNSWKR